jgi:lipopolysaccharide/colanic/teichoic acid biosynthesis glycosyltransferase
MSTRSAQNRAMVNGSTYNFAQNHLSDISFRDGATQLPFVSPALTEPRIATTAPDSSGNLQFDVGTPTDADSVPRIPGWKRLLDVLCIWITFPLWIVVMALVSAWILLVSPGPLLFRQERVGYRGRRFRILKFRTMRVNVETQSHEGYFVQLMQADCPMTKLDTCGDRRLIRGGRLLRALGLDELPQIFNVLCGEMSLVGPRPCTPHEFERYLPSQKQRVNAPPGLTGYWQVNGKNATTFSQMIAMDIHYGKHMSLWLDLMIIVRTGPAIAKQVFESLTRKTGAKVRPLLEKWPLGRLRCWASRFGRRVR